LFDLCPSWADRQWVVTDTGLDTRNGHYPIDVDSLKMAVEPSGWTLFDQLGGKGWVDFADFATAFFVACAVHGVKLTKAHRTHLLSRYPERFEDSLRANAHYGRDEYANKREAA
jgi:hypothetical protein